MSRTPYAAITALAAIIVIGGAITFSSKTQPGNEPAPNEQASSTQSGGTTSVKVALLDYTGESDGKQRGCDRVAMVDRTVPLTQAPLTAAMNELFNVIPAELDGYSSFMPKTAATLKFESATVADGVAKIYLTGSLSGLAGVCDDPRAKIQIEETALQFPTVQSVKLYLNGTETELQPNEQG